MCKELKYYRKQADDALAVIKSFSHKRDHELSDSERDVIRYNRGIMRSAEAMIASLEAENGNC